MQLTFSLKAVRTQLDKVKTKSISTEYQKWRHCFLLERLHLAMWIAITAFPGLVLLWLLLRATFKTPANPGVSSESILLVLFNASAIELCLLLCLVLLKIPNTRRYSELLFLGGSWSLTLIGQIQATLAGEAWFPVIVWGVVFLAQAMLIPISWRLHLISQLGVLFYCVGTNVLFGVNDPSPEAGDPIYYLLNGFYILFISVILDIGVYLYERVLLTEFEYRQQMRVFLHAVSHDLRNPVLGTLMVLKNLRNQPGEKVEVSRAMLDRIIESSDRQLNLINSLIESHAAEIKGVTLYCQPLQLSPLVESAIADLQPMLAKEQATLINLISTHLPSVNADPLQLSRVYQNLIANALKYNPPGLNITLDAKLEGDWIRCTVADNGIGMSQQQCEKLFDLYFRGEQKRQSVGLGLGLFLCRQIVTAHGGEIGVNSRPKEGATFWFTLPLAGLPTPSTQ